ncbi:MAG: hypothetical protein HY815_04640 [Candidatus Riflebacteria bacterium]|nr:hypothetical protein [Candidatus Riflebacteria bacterium]
MRRAALAAVVSLLSATATLSAPRETVPAVAGPGPSSAPAGDFDLTVAYIERTPRYERYRVARFEDSAEGRYPFAEDRGPQVLNPRARRAPAEGEPVTFLAHVKNQGSRISDPVSFRWEIDGRARRHGTLPPVAPGLETVERLDWHWRAGAHSVRFVIDGTDGAFQNNFLQDRIDGAFVQVLVDRPLYERFGKRKNLVGTCSFEDWLQAQSRAMNDMFRRSTYEEIAPRGVETGFRVDRVRVVETGQRFEPDLAFDGESRFRDAPDWPDAVAGRIDPGVLRGWARLMGLTDLGRLDVSWKQNLLKDPQGNSHLRQLRQASPDLMGGGSVQPHQPGEEPLLSSHSVVALNLGAGHRGGFVGDHLWDMPRRTRVRLSGQDGRPLARAAVAGFVLATDAARGLEKIGERLTIMEDGPLWSAETDDQGIVQVPNRKAPARGPTARGHTLRDNPFGDLDAGAGTGVVVLKVESGGQVEFVALYVWQLNLAFWAGQTDEAMVSLPTRIGAAQTGWEPRSFSLAVNEGRVLIEFDEIAHAERYSLYLGPRPDPRTYARPVTCPAGPGRFEVSGLTARATLFYEVTAESGPSARVPAFTGQFSTE